MPWPCCNRRPSAPREIPAWRRPRLASAPPGSTVSRSPARRRLRQRRPAAARQSADQDVACTRSPHPLWPDQRQRWREITIGDPEPLVRSSPLVPDPVGRVARIAAKARGRTSMLEPAGAMLITGAAKRLGAAMALAVARDGYDVALHCHRSREEALALAARIRELGRRAVVVSGDLAREAEAARVVPEAAQAIGPLSVLVNNASTFDLDHLATADRDSWDRHLDTNLRAP